MSFQAERGTVRWRLRLESPPERVYRALATDEGRAAFWAESALESGGRIHFRFPCGSEWQGKILEQRPPRLFRVTYIGGSEVSFELTRTADGGTDLLLTDRGVAAREHGEAVAGWVSVLLALKATVDHSVDLRNHDPERTWRQGYVEN